MFVHDFVTLPMPVLPAVKAVTTVLRTRGAQLVQDAWMADAAVWAAAGLPVDAVTPIAPFVVSVDPLRHRENATVIHITYATTGARLIPSLDADIELAARGPDQSDLQLLGIYSYDEAGPGTAAERSLSHRATVAAIRHLLESLAAAAAGATPESTRHHSPALTSPCDPRQTSRVGRLPADMGGSP